MPFTRESQGTRWLGLIVTWGLCAALIGLHTRAVHHYIQMVDALGRRGAAEVATPMRHIVPSRYADGQMWIRHTITAQASAEASIAAFRVAMLIAAALFAIGAAVSWVGLRQGSDRRTAPADTAQADAAKADAAADEPAPEPMA